MLGWTCWDALGRWAQEWATWTSWRLPMNCLVLDKIIAQNLWAALRMGWTRASGRCPGTDFFKPQKRGLCMSGPGWNSMQCGCMAFPWICTWSTQESQQTHLWWLRLSYGRCRTLAWCFSSARGRCREKSWSMRPGCTRLCRIQILLDSICSKCLFELCILSWDSRVSE